MTMTVNCKYELLSPTEARLSVLNGVFEGSPDFGQEMIEQLRQERSGSEAYGKLLFQVLLPEVENSLPVKGTAQLFKVNEAGHS